MAEALTLVVIGKDPETLGAFDPPEDATHVVWIANTGHRSLSALANHHLGLCQREVFGLCHADVIFGPGSIAAFTEEAMRGAVCGIVGADIEGNYHCSYNGTAGGEISTLDGMAVFFRRDLGLRFDECTFDGMHCHVEDLCLQAHARNIPVTVPKADAHHRNHAQSASWARDYWQYRAKLEAKWRGTPFKTT